MLVKELFLTAEKTIELDAAFMNGKDLNAGAIASVKTIKNPITAAIKVMEQSPHVLLSGRGAEKFAEEKGLEIVDPSYFFTQRRINDLDKIKSIESSANVSIKVVKKSFSVLKDMELLELLPLTNMEISQQELQLVV